MGKNLFMGLPLKGKYGRESGFTVPTPPVKPNLWCARRRYFPATGSRIDIARKLVEPEETFESPCEILPEGGIEIAQVKSATADGTLDRRPN